MQELWEWEQDAEQMDAHLHEGTGDVCLHARDQDGDQTIVRLPWRAARALGVALVNSTAPWAGRDGNPPGTCPVVDPEGWHCTAGAGHRGLHVPAAGQPWAGR